MDLPSVIELHGLRISIDSKPTSSNFPACGTPGHLSFDVWTARPGRVGEIRNLPASQKAPKTGSLFNPKAHDGGRRGRMACRFFAVWYPEPGSPYRRTCRELLRVPGELCQSFCRGVRGFSLQDHRGSGAASVLREVARDAKFSNLIGFVRLGDGVCGPGRSAARLVRADRSPSRTEGNSGFPAFQANEYIKTKCVNLPPN